MEEARTAFRRIAVELNKHFKKLNSACIELDSNERLKMLHNFYRIGEESSFNFDMIDNMQKDTVSKTIYVQIVLSSKRLFQNGR